jgi:hypothetical protein
LGGFLEGVSFIFSSKVQSLTTNPPLGRVRTTTGSEPVKVICVGGPDEAFTPFCSSTELDCYYWKSGHGVEFGKEKGKAKWEVDRRLRTFEDNCGQDGQQPG